MVRKRRLRRIRSYPRRRYRAFRRGKQPISILATAPVVYKALLEPVMGGGGYIGALPMLQAGNPKDAALEFANILSMNFTGYDFKGNTWNMEKPMATYGMMIGGLLGHKLANKMGANKALRKVPIVGKWFSI